MSEENKPLEENNLVEQEDNDSVVIKTQNYEEPNSLVKSETVFKPSSVDEEDLREYFVALMSHRKHVLDVLNNMQKDELPGSEDEQLAHLQMIEEALRTHGVTSDEVSPFEREEADWGNYVEHEGKRIGISRPKTNSVGSGRLTAEAAVLKARAAVMLGTVATVPMWHTGTHISFKAPGDIDLLHLERQMAFNKISLGRATSGLLLSATSMYFTMDIVNSAFSNIFDTTAPDMSVRGLKETHSITDIPFIIGGYASAIYPDGYHLVRLCVADPNSCTYKVEQEVSIPKMHYVDRTALNEYQRNHMLDKNKKKTKEQLEMYKNNHSFRQTDVLEEGDMKIHFSIPSIAKYEDWSGRWIQSIIDHTTEAFGETISAKQRENYMYQRAGASSIMQYGHFVEAIEYEGYEDKITSYDNISKVLTDLSSSSSFRKKFIAKVRSIVKNSSISAVGIPAYTCPACKSEPVNLHPRLKTIIQLEVAEVFFTLMLKRLKSMLSQE